MAYTTIKKPSDYFNTKLYTGTGATHNVTGVGFQPDWVWINNRTGTYATTIFDAVRGATKFLEPAGTPAEQTYADTLTSFDSDGFTLGADTSSFCNRGSAPNSYVAWNWLGANGTASNTDGSITSTVSANTTSGFSIATFTTPSSGTVFDVGHGLGGKPDMMIMKSRGSAADWWTWHIGLGDNTTDYLSLNSSSAEASISGMWGTVGAGTSTFGYTAGTSAPTSTDTVAYFFKSIKGFSKFGSYVGNGNADGTFVYTGFSPAWVMLKRTDASGERWNIKDNKRNGFNQTDPVLTAEADFAERDDAQLDLLSSGFKIRTSAVSTNASGGTYIYMAFAENPLVGTNNIPATAR